MLTIRQTLSTLMNNNMTVLVLLVLLCVFVSPSCGSSTTAKATSAFVSSSINHSAFLSLDTKHESSKGIGHRFGCEVPGRKTIEASGHSLRTCLSAANNVSHLPSALSSQPLSSRRHICRLRMRKDATDSDDEGGGDDKATAVGSKSKKPHIPKGLRLSFDGEKYWKKTQRFFKDLQPKTRKNKEKDEKINGDIKEDSTVLSTPSSTSAEKQSGDSNDVSSSSAPLTAKTSATKSFDDMLRSFFKQLQPNSGKKNDNKNKQADESIESPACLFSLSFFFPKLD